MYYRLGYLKKKNYKKDLYYKKTYHEHVESTWKL